MQQRCAVSLSDAPGKQGFVGVDPTYTQLKWFKSPKS